MNTEYDKPEWLNDTNTRSLYVFVNYVLWDCSTEYMANHGMPTDEQVSGWIDVLNARSDKDDPNIQAAIQDCIEYMAPYVAPPVVERKERPPIEVGKVYVIKKNS